MADSPPLGRLDLWQYPVSSWFFRLPIYRVWLSLASAVEGFFRVGILIEDVSEMVAVSLMSVMDAVAVSLMSVSVVVAVSLVSVIDVVAVSLVSVIDVVAVSLMSVSVVVRSGTVADACCSIF